MHMEFVAGDTMTLAGGGVASSKTVLCIGLACVDNCFVTRHYPEEDSKVGVTFDTNTGNRCLGQEWKRGGNVSNACTVLSQIGCSCELFCTFANDTMLGFIRGDLERCGIKHDKARIYDGCNTPNSSVMISKATGSRTIVHANMNLPELSAADFEQRIVPTDYDWMHFEGRNVVVLKDVLSRYYALPRGTKRPCMSIEIEKTKEGMLDLMYFGDVVFISKDFAVLSGHDNMTDAVQYFSSKRPEATIICAWGELGAAAFDPTAKQIVYSPAFSPPQGVVDTLGAGDTFIAGVISRLVRGETVQQAIEFACRLAGAKCGQLGLKELLKLPGMAGVDVGERK